MQESPGASGSHLPVAPPKPVDDSEHVDPYARLSFSPAAPHQILRAYQRDGSHLHRLSNLISELLRSVAGSRWLARKQVYIDVLIKAIYLVLTLGRSLPTLGEEYTDIAPHVAHRARISRLRRVVAISLLILPSALTSSSLLASLRSRHEGTGPITRLRNWTVKLLESPVGQSLPELSTIAFLYGGTFLEIGRRLTGLSYISTSGGRSAEKPTYESVSLLLALPLGYRLLRWYRDKTTASELRPIPSTAQTTVSNGDPTGRGTEDSHNTYLTDEARDQVERQCTLCLEPRGSGEGSAGTVAVTECGHAFCWGCLAELDKTECPLCRQTLRMERLIAAYNL